MHDWVAFLISNAVLHISLLNTHTQSTQPTKRKCRLGVIVMRKLRIARGTYELPLKRQFDSLHSIFRIINFAGYKTKIR